VTAVSYYWKGATKWGAFCCVVYGTGMSIYGGWKVLFKKEVGLGTFEWWLVIGCGIIYFVVSAITKKPSQELLDRLFPAKN
jgi:Na+/proline symporter